jgi:hypothetical protein
MNCSVCKKPIEEHGESRETDRCVAEKLGWKEIKLWKETKDLDEYMEGRIPTPVGEWMAVPHYSSPEMSPETWGLVERMGVWFSVGHYISFGDDEGWSVSIEEGGEDFIIAPTPTLAICRAYLAMETE